MIFRIKRLVFNYNLFYKLKNSESYSQNFLEIKKKKIQDLKWLEDNIRKLANLVLLLRKLILFYERKNLKKKNLSNILKLFFLNIKLIIKKKKNIKILKYLWYLKPEDPDLNFFLYKKSSFKLLKIYFFQKKNILKKCKISLLNNYLIREGFSNRLKKETLWIIGDSLAQPFLYAATNKILKSLNFGASVMPGFCPFSAIQKKKNIKALISYLIKIKSKFKINKFIFYFGNIYFNNLNKKELNKKNFIKFSNEYLNLLLFISNKLKIEVSMLGITPFLNNTFVENIWGTNKTKIFFNEKLKKINNINKILSDKCYENKIKIYDINKEIFLKKMFRKNLSKLLIHHQELHWEDGPTFNYWKKLLCLK